MDLFSAATVVAAFIAGLGLGSLLGGTLADRLGASRSILAFAAANASIGLFGWASIAIFYDGYRALAVYVQSLPAAFAFHFVLLVAPTTLIGVSLPLLLRGTVRTIGEAAPVAGASMPRTRSAPPSAAGSCSATCVSTAPCGSRAA